MMTANSGSLVPASPCAEFQQRIRLYLADPTAQQVNLTATLAHLQTCRRCQMQVGSLLQGLRIDQEDMLTCADAEARLPDYVDASVLDKVADARWHTLHLHLATCPHCRALLMELRQVVEATVQPVVNRRAAPPPNLSFLLRPTPRPIAVAEVKWRIDELGAVLIEFSRRLLDAFPPPVALGLKGQASRKILCRVELSEVFADLAVLIIAQEAFQDPAHCELLIDVDVPSRGGWPNLAGMAVVVRHGSQWLDRQLTDAYGKVVFAGIRTDDLTQLTVEVQPQVA